MEPTQPIPTTRNSMMIPVAIVFAGLLVAGAVVYNGSSNKGAPVVANPAGQDAPVNIKPITDQDHILGNPKATLLVVEYSDLECPFCKQYHATLKQMMAELGKDSKVAWVYRHFPIYKGTETQPPLHSKAGKEAEATECAAELGGNAAFWKFTDRVYEVTPSNNGLDAATLPDIAEFAGLNRSAFTACLSSGKYAAKIETAYNDATAAGAQGTPYTVVVDTRDGKTYPIDAGAIPWPALSAMLKSLLAK